jgi:hypothetical protein
MISAWDVYWVMQLDSIVAAFGAATFLLVAIAVAAGIAWIFAKGDSDPEAWLTPEFKAKALRNRNSLPALRAACLKLSVAAISSLLVLGLLPSTKTAAAMVVLPAIANNETLHTEAGELYGLAKQALKEAVGAEKSE